MFATEESSPFDVAAVELEESVPGFVPPCLADTFLPGKRPRWVGGGTCGVLGVCVTPLHPPPASPHPQERR